MWLFSSRLLLGFQVSILPTKKSSVHGAAKRCNAEKHTPSTLSSLPPCQCCVSAPPLSLIASSRLDTPALCHTVAADKWNTPTPQVQPFAVICIHSSGLSECKLYTHKKKKTLHTNLSHRRCTFRPLNEDSKTSAVLKNRTDDGFSFRRGAGRGGGSGGWRQHAHHSTKPQPDVPEPGRQVGQGPPPTHCDSAGNSSNLLGITFISHAFPGTAGRGAAICPACCGVLREREGGNERERKCVCVCVSGFRGNGRLKKGECIRGQGETERMTEKKNRVSQTQGIKENERKKKDGEREREREPASDWWSLLQFISATKTEQVDKMEKCRERSIATTFQGMYHLPMPLLPKHNDCCSSLLKCHR
ncbi:uncharacterized protein V6R79_017651 [Siganus canaliculatus]